MYFTSLHAELGSLSFLLVCIVSWACHFSKVGLKSWDFQQSSNLAELSCESDRLSFHSEAATSGSRGAEVPHFSFRLTCKVTQVN